MRRYIAFSLFLVFASPAWAAGGVVLKMATTTSTENSGLLDVLIPAFTEETGIRVKVFAKGTGAALRDGMDGNVDVVFVHARKREERFVAEGYGAYRLGVMHNDFVILGPGRDPAGIKGMSQAALAFRKIAETRSHFVSRGDDSGTHTKEQALWRASGVHLSRKTTEIFRKGKKRTLTFLYPGGLGRWYLSIGQGMGKVLTFAEEKQAYTFSDRGTYLKFRYGRRQGLDLGILCQGDPVLYNPYGIIPLNPKRFPHVAFRQADRLARWLVSPHAQRLIAGYRIAGRQAFFPDALGNER
ncbi:MAG: tungsten ABC transporter substrate-binding protein [Deltaproteobacteria bacterium]|nr:MAG: tungsten ABC transporter substrate-binding protein [Deltaproteobacteria bacterium]